MVGRDFVFPVDVSVKLVAGDDLVLLGFAGLQVRRLAVFAYDGDLPEVVESSLIFGVFFGEVD